MKEILNNTYVVPYDFTMATENALKYCLKLTNQNKGSVKLVHVVKKEKQIAEAKRKLEKIISAYSVKKSH